MHWPLFVVLEIFLPRGCNRFYSIDRLFCSFLPFRFFFFFDFIEHERVEVMMSFFEQTLSKKKLQLHNLCFALNHHPSIFLFIESFFLSNKICIFFFVNEFLCLRTVTTEILYVYSYINGCVKQLTQNWIKREVGVSRERESERAIIFSWNRVRNRSVKFINQKKGRCISLWIICRFISYSIFLSLFCVLWYKYKCVSIVVFHRSIWEEYI